MRACIAFICWWISGMDRCLPHLDTSQCAQSLLQIIMKDAVSRKKLFFIPRVSLALLASSAPCRTLDSECGEDVSTLQQALTPLPHVLPGRQL